MRTLNYFDSLIIGTEEMIQLNSFTREELYTFLHRMGEGFKKGIGILSRSGDLGDEFQTTVISASNPPVLTIKGGVGVGIARSQWRYPMVPPNISGFPNTANHSPEVTNLNFSVIYNSPDYINHTMPALPIVGDGGTTERYLYMHPVLSVLEHGTCNVTTEGVVTFSNSSVTKKLRGHLSVSPVKLKFYQTVNSEFSYGGAAFEVVEITSDSTAIILGNIPENLTNYRVAIVGSYDLLKQPDLENKFLYTRVEGSPFIGTITPTGGGFPIAKLITDNDTGAILSYEDIRGESLYKVSPEVYIHPATHPASMIEQETDLRFVSDAEKRIINPEVLTLDTIDPIWDLNNGFRATLNLVGSRNLTISNQQSGDTGLLVVTNNGAHSLTFPSGSYFSFGRNTVGQGLGVVTMVSWTYIGSTYYFTLTPYTF